MMASMVEAFKEPLRVLEKKFTKSEMILVAWRSQEVAHKMKSSMPSQDQPEQQPAEEEIDLSKMTGLQAVNYLNTFGGFNIAAFE